MTLSIQALASRGQLAGFLEHEGRIAQRSAARAVTKSAQEVKEAARAEVRRGFPESARIATGIRSKLYGEGVNLEAALVYSAIGSRKNGQFIDYLALFERSRILVPHAGSSWLVIPFGEGGRKRLERVRKRQLGGGEKNIKIIPSGRPGKLWLVRTGGARSKRVTLLAILLKRSKVTKRVDFQALYGIRDRTISATLNTELTRNG